MSDQNIKVGDRAVVVKWPCCGKFLDKTVLVTSFYKNVNAKIRCTNCLLIHRKTVGVFVEDHTQPEKIGALCLCPIEYLRKLPDLTEGEPTETVVNKPVTV